VSTAELKSTARAVLPPSSPLRRIIVSEPEYLSADEVPARVAVYSRLLRLEVDG
jgi:hypothetical protein